MKKILKITLITLLFIGISLFFLRCLSPREIDDVNPLKQCEKEYLEKADILWVIPLLNNKSISKNQTWCKEILKLNKTLGLHGITHSYREFENKNITQKELNKAIQEFEKCFEFKPKIFKAPNLYLNSKNKRLIQKNNLTLKHRFNQAIHKTYHCSNSGTLPNWFHDWF